MKLRHPALIRLLGFASAWLIKGWHSTLRMRVDSAASGGLPLHPRRGRCIYAFWHENMFVATRFGAKTNVLISQHADGDLSAQITRHMKMGAVRGSSRRGGSGALLELLRLDKARHIAITPDGPRGPRRRLQPGVVFLASRTGLPIVLVGVGYEKAWRARSWDRFAVPYPFSLTTCVTTAPIHVPAGLRKAALESYRRLIEERLEYITEDADRWATGRPRLTQCAPFAPPLAISA